MGQNIRLRHRWALGPGGDLHARHAGPGRAVDIGPVTR
jgi:hypothetical protein